MLSGNFSCDRFGAGVGYAKSGFLPLDPPFSSTRLEPVLSALQAERSNQCSTVSHGVHKILHFAYAACMISFYLKANTAYLLRLLQRMHCLRQNKSMRKTTSFCSQRPGGNEVTNLIHLFPESHSLYGL